MTTRRLCIDIDNVLAQTDRVIRELIREHTAGRIELRYEDIVTFDYRQCEDSNGDKITDKEWADIHDAFSEEENILRLRPYPGIQDYLQVLINAGFKLHFATSRLVQARIPTVRWLEKYNFPDHRLHFVSHREKHLVLGPFFAAIEDDLVQARDFAKQGTLAYLIAHPWNVTNDAENLLRLKDWKEICEHLQGK